MKNKFTHYKIILLPIAIIILSLSSFTCKSNPVKPKTSNPPPPGRRDYVWSVDTLNYPYDPIYRMWGSSSSDIWTTSLGNWDKSISHFNGNKWETYGINGITNPSSIYGFLRDNIFIGGENGAIWHFDGNNWKKVAQITEDGHSDIVFDGIWGDAPNDIFAFGAYPDKYGYANNSVIVHYDGNQWKAFDTNGLKGIVERVFKNKSDGIIYARTTSAGEGKYPDSTLIYEYYNKKFIKIYASPEIQGFQSDLSLISDEVYFILGNKIAIRSNNQFQIILKVENQNFYNRIWGRNPSDIFLFMVDGLAHYNGTNIKYLFHFNKLRSYVIDGCMFDKEIFFDVLESQTNLSLIYHGILKQQ